ncbi:stetterlysin-like protease [Thermococcus cleftensis]|uniref:Stetterlysin-like protease n=1 Tax=Thermococcus cleftensis (strain DSM 27260 / KACC 17922 / CL1) TaxID=163003 RepID=I3ZSM7_THECF|nr:S8 family serine peptidase [Thermococcus cleftensis]AFL94711.1 stetterlysin-like protease [Thermococcus cleftensis]
MNKRALSLLIAVVMLLSAIPAAVSVPAVTATPVQQVESPQQVAVEKSSNFIPGEVLQKEIQKVLESSGKTVRLIVAPDKDHKIEVYNALKRLGKIDPISKPEFQFIVVEMPVSNVEKLAEIPGILHVWKDEMVKLQEPVAPEAGMDDVKPAVQDPNLPDMFMSVFTIHAYDTWINYGVLGDNVTVAVLDTGIDVGHPFLQVTLDGRPKIIDIYDASDEGLVEIYYSTNTTSGGYIAVDQNVTLYWGAYAPYYGHETYTNYTMGTYYVGNITGDDYYLGLLPERYFDLNNFTGTPYDPYNLGLFGDLSDVYPVLIVNQSGNFIAYIDLNLDNNFTNDQPIGVFDLTHDYVTVNSTKVNIAFQGFYGDFAYFMWDAHGHGTHVSGTVAGVGLPDDPVFGGVYGVAPNAQLMEVKVLPGELGFGRTSWIISGMIYATLNGADVISMSLGGGGEINDGIESPENFYVNLITDWFGVTFAIAAGNEGPTTNTVHSPGDSDLAITVGNYVDNERESFWYGFDMGIISGPSMSSSRGPRDDGMLDPDVMAPGTDIFSSLPMWYTVLYGNPYRYYGIWSGTSMATPHVSGAVALLISYAKQHNLTYDPIMIKRALEFSAKPVNGTLIDQGFGLIQVDKAIEELEKLSQEPTTYIFAGTTYTGFKNPIGVPTIPVSPAYVDFNGYFQNVFGFPYLYRGVYIRNEYPGSVPIYFSPLVYEPGWGLWYVFQNKTYRISTNVDWIIPNTTEVTINGADAYDINDLIGQFSINIDYSKLQKSGTYVGLVYIDDPDTSYIDGYVAVTVDIPVNPNGESHAKLSDTEKPGEAKHYFVKVPRGTKELRVTLRVPADAEGNPMGRTTLLIARPLGEVVAAYVPGYYYVGANPAGNVYEYTWVIPNPVEGTWEITAYSSIFTKYFSGYDTSQYEIEVSLASVSIEPELLLKDVAQPSNVTVKATVTNNYGDFNATAVGYGVGRLDAAYTWTRNVSQDDWDVVGAFYADPTTYFIRFGITQPEDPTADLDLYVFYFPTLEDLLNFENYTVYDQQVGPTSDEVFEQFMPKSGYYLVMVYGWDTAGYNPVHYTFYFQMLGDNGNVEMQTGSFLFQNGGTADLKARVELESSGTYLGVLSLINNNTGEAMTYAPMIFQVGMPEMSIVVYPEATLGKPSKLIIKLLDLATMEPINKSATVMVNGREYHTDNGQVVVDYVPLHLVETIKIKATSPYYQDACTEVTVRAREPVETEVYSPITLKPYVAVGVGEVTEVTTDKTTLTITANGPSGAEDYIFVTMPVDTSYIKITGDHVIDYYTIEGKNALYAVIKVKYASPVTVTIEYRTARFIVSTWNYVWFMLYWRYDQKFDPLYQKAVELGVDNETLQEALMYKELADKYYEEAEKYLTPGRDNLAIAALPHIRKAYMNILKAYNILESAIKEIEG